MNLTSTLGISLLIVVASLCAAFADPLPRVVTQPGDDIRAVGDPGRPDNGAASDYGEGVEKAIDGTNAKYYNRSVYGGGYTGSGYIVTPALGATIVTGLSITSGNDSPGRDPVSFSLFGSNDDGKTLVPIVVGQAIPAFQDRNQN